MNFLQFWPFIFWNLFHQSVEYMSHYESLTRYIIPERTT